MAETVCAADLGDQSQFERGGKKRKYVKKLCTRGIEWWASKLGEFLAGEQRRLAARQQRCASSSLDTPRRQLRGYLSESGKGGGGGRRIAGKQLRGSYCCYCY